MKVSCTFTLNELQRITPNLRKEHFFSECPKVKEALRTLFWRLGCTIEDKWDVTEGVVSRNRLNELDDSMRITVYERLDEPYLRSKYASHQARVCTNDVGMMRELDACMNQRSFHIETLSKQNKGESN